MRVENAKSFGFELLVLRIMAVGEFVYASVFYC